jgi:hypothetical protein
VFALFHHPTVRDLAAFLGAKPGPAPATDDGTAAQLRVGKDRLRRRLAKAQFEPADALEQQRPDGSDPREADRPGRQQEDRPPRSPRSRQGGKEVA